MNRRIFSKQLALLGAGFSIIPSCGFENQKFILKDGMKIAFIGDSITQAGGYIELLRSFIAKRYPDKKVELINLGLSGETITGLTEESHPGPRPYLFDRLESLLDEHKPDVAFYCYGINCGIYQPFSQDTMDRYKQGFERIEKETTSRNIELVLMTPPPFALTDEQKNTLLSENLEIYTWQKPWPDYDEDVMIKEYEFVKQFAESEEYRLIDIRTPLFAQKEKAYSVDPIHPNETGHGIIASAIVKQLFEEKVSF
ncbi:MAG: SGNH/GDSL hydrolase family protein [Cyclobacteriaceae bacterium]